MPFVADPNDAFWLAQTYFLTGHYLRAERILTEPLPPPALLQLATNGAAKGKERAHDVHLENVMRDRSAHAPTSTSDGTEGRVALASKSLACRYLVVQCLVSSLSRTFTWAVVADPLQVHQEKYSEALELLGESQPFSATSTSIYSCSSAGRATRAHDCRLEQKPGVSNTGAGRRNQGGTHLAVSFTYRAVLIHAARFITVPTPRLAPSPPVVPRTRQGKPDGGAHA